MNQSLTVLDPSSAASDDAATIVRLFHRCELDDARELGEETLLDAGIAICSPALARVSDGNRVFDAYVPDDTPVEHAAQDVLNHFASRGVTCRKWAPNPSSTPAQTARLTNHLESLGYVRHASCIMRLMSRRTLHEPTTAGVTIIPARASFRHARTLAEFTAHDTWREPQLAGAAMARLDNPRYEQLIALRDGRAVASAAVLTAGEVGMVDTVFVVPEARRQGLGRLMMNRILDHCARALFRHVLLRTNFDNTCALPLFKSLGFEPVGEFVEWVTPQARP